MHVQEIRWLEAVTLCAKGFCSVLDYPLAFAELRPRRCFADACGEQHTSTFL